MKLEFLFTFSCLLLISYSRAAKTNTKYSINTGLVINSINNLFFRQISLTSKMTFTPPDSEHIRRRFSQTVPLSSMSTNNPTPHILSEGENAAPLEVIGCTATDSLVIVMVGVGGNLQTNFKLFLQH